MRIRFLVLFLVCLVFIVAFASASSPSNTLQINIQTTDNIGNVITGTFNFTFNISLTSNCLNVLYSNTTTHTTDVRGIVIFQLTNVNLNFTDQYWICYYRDGILKNVSTIAKVPYSFYADIAGRSPNNFNQELNTTNSPSFANITIGGRLPCLNDSTNCQNNSGIGYTNLALVNISNNFTGATDNFTAINIFNDVTIKSVGVFQWLYNQTLGALNIVNTNFWNKTQSYNSTQIDNNFTNYYTKSQADANYSSIVFGYNFTQTYGGSTQCTGTNKVINVTNINGNITLVCASDQTGGGIGATNVAWQNQTNVFTQPQEFTGNFSTYGYTAIGANASYLGSIGTTFYVNASNDMVVNLTSGRVLYLYDGGNRLDITAGSITMNSADGTLCANIDFTTANQIFFNPCSGQDGINFNQNALTFIKIGAGNSANRTIGGGDVNSGTNAFGSSILWKCGNSTGNGGCEQDFYVVRKNQGAGTTSRTPTKILTLDMNNTRFLGEKFIYNGNTTGMGVCSTINEGAIYYDTALHHHYGCNSTNWYALY